MSAHLRWAIGMSALYREALSALLKFSALFLRGSHPRLSSCKFAAMRFNLIFMLLAVSCGLAAAPPEGIPRELARERANRISNVRYQLQFTLVPHAPSAAGHEELRFHLNSAGPVLLDFREGAADKLVVNGMAAPAAIENGHITLPETALRIGDAENVVSTVNG